MMKANEPRAISEKSVLTRLRGLAPQRPVSYTQLVRIAEQQAGRLLGCFGIRHWPVPETILLELPRITVEQRYDLPTSGCSFWDSDRRTWVIQVNGTEPTTRQRFTLLHEYKHIVDHGRVELLYGSGTEGRTRAEQAADFFAGCALVPRVLLKRAWGDGIQDVSDLAGAFDVSAQAIAVRLAQTGLVEQAPRCRMYPARNEQPSRVGDAHVRTTNPYFRTLDEEWLRRFQEVVA